MTSALVHIATVAYAASAALYLWWLIRPRPVLAINGRALLAVGLAFHVASLIAAPQGVQVFSMLAAALAACFLVLDLAYRLPVAGVFTAPLVVVVMVPAHFGGPGALRLGHETTYSVALVLHVLASSLGTIALALAFALALVYLAGERQLKRKQPGRVFSRLPSLELVDRVGWKLAAWAFAFLSLALATGSFAERASSGAFFSMAPKQGFAAGAWALLAVLVVARLLAGWRGRRAAILVLVGCALLGGAYGGLLWSAKAAAHAAAGRA